MRKETTAPLKIHNYLGWIVLGMVLIPLIGASLFLHVKENRELTSHSLRWEENWPQLKIGMSKEEVLALVGAPHSTTVLEMTPDNITSDPPDEKIEQGVRDDLAQRDNYAIWSYHIPLVIHTHPGEDLKTAVNDGEIQLKELINYTGQDKLHGHAIKFDGDGRIIEIYPPVSSK